MRNSSSYKNILKLSRTCFCVVLIAFMVVATTSIQITHVESHENTITNHGASADLISLLAKDNVVASSVDASQQGSPISEQPKQIIFAVTTTKQEQVNVYAFKSYFTSYTEFNYHARATLISYLHHKSLPSHLYKTA